MFVDRGKLEEGLELHQRAYDGFRQAIGKDQRIWTATLPAGHLNLTMNLEAWADVLRRLGEDERATRVDEQLREIGAPAGRVASGVTVPVSVLR